MVLDASAGLGGAVGDELVERGAPSGHAATVAAEGDDDLEEEDGEDLRVSER